MRITIFTDNQKSWFVPFGRKLNEKLLALGHDSNYIFDKNDISEGDVCFLLSCSKLLQKDYLLRNKNNIVVHASDLPSGKGFSPLQWQILENKDKIVLTLFEVDEAVDSGPYYFKDNVTFFGYELYDEMREILGDKIVEMCVIYSESKDKLAPIEQEGIESFYKKRNFNDDEININLTIAEQFNLIRIADFENYPLWFNYLGKKYFIKVERQKD